MRHIQAIPTNCLPELIAPSVNITTLNITRKDSEHICLVTFTSNTHVSHPTDKSDAGLEPTHGNAASVDFHCMSRPSDTPVDEKNDIGICTP